MSKVAYAVTASAHIDAPPDRVYGIIADYRAGHPSILPAPFKNFVVEQGESAQGRSSGLTSTPTAR